MSVKDLGDREEVRREKRKEGKPSAVRSSSSSSLSLSLEKENRKGSFIPCDSIEKIFSLFCCQNELIKTLWMSSQCSVQKFKFTEERLKNGIHCNELSLQIGTMADSRNGGDVKSYVCQLSDKLNKTEITVRTTSKRTSCQNLGNRHDSPPHFGFVSLRPDTQLI